MDLVEPRMIKPPLLVNVCFHSNGAVRSSTKVAHSGLESLILENVLCSVLYLSTRFWHTQNVFITALTNQAQALLVLDTQSEKYFEIMFDRTHDI